MRTRLALMAAALIGLPAANALAAPQLLGVVATAEPIPMQCEAGRCTVELSSFCLEEERSMPVDGDAYTALDPDKLTLWVTSADGTTRSLAAAPYVSIASERNFVAVSVSLPSETAQRLGAVKLAIAVAPELTLAPVPVAGDPRPITADEIAKARATLRPTATRFFESGATRNRVAQVMNRLINSLPAERDNDPAVRAQAWRSVTGRGLQEAASDPVLAEAAQIYEYCQTDLPTIWPRGLRRCLESSHDSVMTGINADFWHVIGAGS